jgi:hypothetical protein
MLAACSVARLRDRAIQQVLLHCVRARRIMFVAAVAVLSVAGSAVPLEHPLSTFKFNTYDYYWLTRRECRTWTDSRQAGQGRAGCTARPLVQQRARRVHATALPQWWEGRAAHTMQGLAVGMRVVRVVTGLCGLPPQRPRWNCPQRGIRGVASYSRRAVVGPPTPQRQTSRRLGIFVAWSGGWVSCQIV